MLSLLTAFFLYYGDAHWGWWIVWSVLTVHHLCMWWDREEV